MTFAPELGQWIQAPGVALPDQTKHGREIVGENNGTEPTTVDQPGGLEDLLFLLDDDFSTIWGANWDGIRVLPRSALIDLQELLGDILHTISGKYTRNPVLGTRRCVHCDCG